MKDMPFFLLKNPFGAKMKKGIRTFCSNDGSTSTLNQHNISTIGNSSINNSQGDLPSKVTSPTRQSPPTLEDLILQLEMEEEMARKAKLNEYSGIRGRMSCVNNSDILRSARNALNQYPRFSLDGRDAMYRSSFGNMEGRRSVCSERIRSLGGMLMEENDLDSKFDKEMSLPRTVAGESVVWCKPGVVAKLMGLEAMPVPIRSSSKRSDSKEKLSSVVRKQNLRRRFERHDLERKLKMEMQGYHHHDIRKNRTGCSRNNGYCVVNPVALEALTGGPGSWKPRRYA